ncbi:hypothetical protein F5878DRAFT_605549 [Lentinula raphanica]|uniref:Uncharacterized protein n=1 Tax=Lentinula raphanica TaxID=153919 RepID=A0AA38PHT5_9AGAR|nr:hypothetical protein F5878DRAFT_605549 [Lentinula raphanica]
MQLRLSFVLLGLAVATYARPINYALQARSEVTPSTPYRTPTVHADSATLNRRVVTSTAAVEGSSPTSTVFPTGSNVSGTPTQGTSVGGISPAATVNAGGSGMPLVRRIQSDSESSEETGFFGKLAQGAQHIQDKEDQTKANVHNGMAQMKQNAKDAVNGVKDKVEGGFKGVAGAAGGAWTGLKNGYEAGAGANANSQPPPPNNV